MLIEPHVALRIDSRDYVLESARAPLQGRSSAPFSINHVQELYLEV